MDGLVDLFFSQEATLIFMNMWLWDAKCIVWKYVLTVSTY